ncbi:MAG: glycosyltransferase family 2 protein [Patescibacteria group bacterium]|nr:glycosyltransferase family 2 protein [Patescibacteria group bacterium]
MKEPLVFIIVLNWNGFEETVECLKQLEAVDYSNFKVVVVDNGSKNNEAERIKEKYSKIILIKNKSNKGFVVANNQGVQIALKGGAKYILFLNNDTYFHKDFLGKLVDYMETKENVGICGPVIKYYNSDRVWSAGGKYIYFGLAKQLWKGKKYGEFKEVVKEPQLVEFVSGCALLIRESIVRKIGMLDPIYFAYVEDVDICFRCKKAGFEVILVPESVVEHKKSSTTGVEGSRKFSALQTFLIIRNNILFARKNLSGFARLLNLFGVLTVKLGYFMIFSKDAQARARTIAGVVSGFSSDLENGNNIKFKFK